MADGTRFRHLDEAVKKLSDTSTAHATRLDTFQSTVSDLVVRVTELTGMMEQSLRMTTAPTAQQPGSVTPTPTSDSTSASNFSFPQPRNIRLEFPRFDGNDPVGWLFKAERFFGFHHTPDDQRLTISSFHMDGPALQWFQWMHKTTQFPTWPAFTRSLEVCFGPTDYDDPQGSLSKLTQTTSVAHYQSQFEALANRTTGATPKFLVSCFISGLLPAIQSEVLAFRPTTMAHAVGLARLQEAKLHDTSWTWPRPSNPAPFPSANLPSYPFHPHYQYLPSFLLLQPVFPLKD